MTWLEQCADVGIVTLVEGAFDLYAAKEAAVIGGDVVGGGFSPGLVAAESALGGALHETEFGPLSAELGVLDVGEAIWHGDSLGETCSCEMFVLLRSGRARC